jgi:hypothetical protein
MLQTIIIERVSPKSKSLPTPQKKFIVVVSEKSVIKAMSPDWTELLTMSHLLKIRIERNEQL